MSSEDTMSEGTALLSPTDPSTMSGRQKIRWLFSMDTLTRKADVDEVLARESANEGGGLKKVLTIFDIIAYGIAYTVGSGIFVTVGQVAHSQAGPAVLFSFLVAAFASLLSAFCYAEFSARIPVAGSAYTFAYVAMGELIAWLIGWNLTLEYAISGSAVAKGWANYLVSFIGVFHAEVPSWLHNYHPWDPSETSFFSLSLLSVIIIVICTSILLLGAKESAWFNKIITVLNLAVLLFIIIVGSTKVDTANWSNFFPFGVRGVFQGAGQVFFAYIGFDSVTTLASESANPKRDLPLGVILTLVIATSLYVAVSLVLTGMLNYKLVSRDAPLSNAFFSVGLPWAGGIVAAISVTTLMATTLASLLSQPRIFMQMSQDGLFFSPFKHVNSRQVPLFGTIVTGLLAAILAFAINLDALADMISIGTLLAFYVVCGGIIMTRMNPQANIVIERYGRWACVEGLAREVQRSVIWILLVFSIASIGLGVNYNTAGPVWISGVWGGILFLCWLLLCCCRDQFRPTTFKAPLSPLVPLVGMLSNLFIITSRPWDSCVRVVIWSFIGMLIYFFYGAWNSQLNKSSQRTGKINGTHDD